MRAIWCGFALGVIVLQRQAALPGRGAWAGLVLAIVLAAGWAAWALGAGNGRRWRVVSGWAAVWLAAGCAGLAYAAWRAPDRSHSPWRARRARAVQLPYRAIRSCRCRADA